MAASASAARLCVRAARSRRWSQLLAEEHRAHVMRLLDALEVTDRDRRLKAARAVLYLAQGECVRAHVATPAACFKASLRSFQGHSTSATPRLTSSAGPDTTSSCSTTWGSSARCWSCSAWRWSEWGGCCSTCVWGEFSDRLVFPQQQPGVQQRREETRHLSGRQHRTQVSTQLRSCERARTPSLAPLITPPPHRPPSAGHIYT